MIIQWQTLFGGDVLNSWGVYPLNRRFRTISVRTVVYICLLAVFSANSAISQEFVKSRGKLSDQDFYRIVACAAPPGGKCQKSIIKWSERDRKGLTIGFTKIDSSISERKKGAAMVALKNAVSQINGVGSGVRLVLIDAGKPDISVVLTAGTIMEVDRTPRTIKEFALSTGAAAIAQVDMPRGSNVIRAATVTISKRVKDRHLKSIMLEEVIQSLGLLTDIHNEYYHNRSIFSEVGSSVSRLRGQDAKALLYHYPRDG